MVEYQYVEEVNCGRGRGANWKNTVENPNTQLKMCLLGWLMNGQKPWMRTSWLDQARPQQGFWLGKSLDSTQEDGMRGGEMKWFQNYHKQWVEMAEV